MTATFVPPVAAFAVDVLPEGPDSSIADRKSAEAALRAREAQLHAFVEQAPAAIAMFDLVRLGHASTLLADSCGWLMGRLAHGTRIDSDVLA